MGGAHENERRAGTENLASITGFVDALELFVRKPVFADNSIRPLTDLLAATISGIDGAMLVGSQSRRLANTLAFVVRDSDSAALLAALDLEGVCASSGSACSAGSLEPSHVITALGFDTALASALVRFSLGRDSTLAEVEQVQKLLPGIVRRAQRLHKP